MIVTRTLYLDPPRFKKQKYALIKAIRFANNTEHRLLTEILDTMEGLYAEEDQSHASQTEETEKCSSRLSDVQVAQDERLLQPQQEHALG